ncbi:uncharacterized protein A4U43_C07F31210, partial [Asparagus officinalis]
SPTAQRIRTKANASSVARDPDCEQRTANDRCAIVSLTVFVTPSTTADVSAAHCRDPCPPPSTRSSPPPRDPVPATRHELKLIKFSPFQVLGGKYQSKLLEAVDPSNLPEFALVWLSKNLQNPRV